MIGRYRWVESRTSLGRRFRHVEPIVPRVVREILHSVVYLYKTADAAREGEAVGGTGFLTSAPVGNVIEVGDEEDLRSADESDAYLYVVTARHVIRRGAPVVRMNTNSGVEVLDLPPEAWIPHPDGTELAVAPIGRFPSQREFSFGHVPHRLYLTKLECEGAVMLRTGPGPGDECFFIGRFLPHEGRERNQPTVRFGNLAMMPGDPIRDEESGLQQESFLVEARSLSGYSGSPVFIYSTAGMDPDGKVSPWVKSYVRFLGVDWCHLYTWEPVRDADKKTVSEPKQWVKRNTGMAGVIPAWKLAELLNDEEVLAMRMDDAEQRRRELEASPGGATLDTADESEFDRFEDLTRKLVQVPKNELDEKRKDES